MSFNYTDIFSLTNLCVCVLTSKLGANLGFPAGYHGAWGGTAPENYKNNRLTVTLSGNTTFPLVTIQSVMSHGDETRITSHGREACDIFQILFPLRETFEARMTEHNKESFNKETLMIQPFRSRSMYDRKRKF